MNETYNPAEIEAKWQERWEREQVFRAPDRPDGEKFYVLEMFPYPSGDLHMGHVRNYSIGDVMSRFYRMNGRQVLHPMGFDSFGLPAENAAVKDGVPPQIRTPKNIERVRAQMKALGFDYDWSREIATHTPEYYRWNQWFFLRMWERGIVYRRQAAVNWCPKDLTVLANEQVFDGRCWRCDTLVEQKSIPEWAFRITRYAQSLLDDLALLKEWPDRITTMQEHWIGRSEGCELDFSLVNAAGQPTGQTVRVFTTRPDTTFGCTFVVLAPEHPLVNQITTPEQRADVIAFVARMKDMTREERLQEGGVKEGVPTGAYAINPFTGEKIPVWLANFVLAGYGAGAVMSVPAHDQRDYEFARKYGLPIRVVIQPVGELPADQAWTGPGTMVASGEFTGLSNDEGKFRMIDAAEQGGFGKRSIQWHLRDWGFSRQRYWGTPIPVIHCEGCGPVPVPDDQLPVLLPNITAFKSVGDAPLGRVPEFVNAPCPKCGQPARREVETMDTFVDSAWYYARFISPRDDKHPFDVEAARQWLPIDLYIGGPEHAVMHLLYFRFWHKVMREMGLVFTPEPAAKLLTQGMVVAPAYRSPSSGKWWSREELKDGRDPETGEEVIVTIEKMSKSKRNGVDPLAMLQRYGADTLRLFCLFATPPEKDVEWSEHGVEGAHRFIQRVWRLAYRNLELARGQPFTPVDHASLTGAARDFNARLHQAIDRVTTCIAGQQQYNTAIAACMELTNEAYALFPESRGRETITGPERALLVNYFDVVTRLLAPMAPHLCEEIWAALGRDALVCVAPWPKADPAALVKSEVTYAVQVNGKLRGEIRVSADASRERIEQAALAEPAALRHREGKEIKRVIVVPNRLVNIVVG
ncbi:MAG: Leucine--tRNA ligase [Myxococcota bacterium]|nr:Leucine--tRNA ligase [Myxococcota bacterium]